MVPHSYMNVHLGFSQRVINLDCSVEYNVIAIMCVCVAVQNCIMPGIGEPSITTYHSLVQYHNATPVFHETIKVLHNNLRSQFMYIYMSVCFPAAVYPP